MKRNDLTKADLKKIEEKRKLLSLMYDCEAHHEALAIRRANELRPRRTHIGC